MASITITEIMNGAWKKRAVYTAEERGIPSFADGLKPVHRYLISKGLKIARSKFEKVATIATVATEGYHHGEASAASALVGLAADYSNNLPIFEGDGNFGNILDPSAGAPRYIYARLSSVFEYLYKDMDLCPIHDDPEHIPPLYYLPIIPMVLVNGIKGIATGFATDIPPHDPVTIIEWLYNRTHNKQKNNILPKYYNFSGTVDIAETQYILHGKYELISPIRIRITELPRGNTSESYERYLRKILDKGIIVDYENNSCKDKFDFIVVIKKGTRWTEEQIRKNLKLDSVHTWNLTTVSTNGKIQEWKKETGIYDILESFYNFRLPFIVKRIENKKKYYDNKIKYTNGIIKFCYDAKNQKIDLRNISEKELEYQLKTVYMIPEEYIQKVMDLPIRSFTTEMINKKEEELEQFKKKVEYYSNTNAEFEYRKDLDELNKWVRKNITN